MRRSMQVNKEVVHPVRTVVTKPRVSAIRRIFLESHDGGATNHAEEDTGAQVTVEDLRDYYERLMVDPTLKAPTHSSRRPRPAWRSVKGDRQDPDFDSSWYYDTDCSTQSETSSVSWDESPQLLQSSEQPQHPVGCDESPRGQPLTFFKRSSSDVRSQHQSKCTEPAASSSNPIQSLPECPCDTVDTECLTLSDNCSVNRDEPPQSVSSSEQTQLTLDVEDQRQPACTQPATLPSSPIQPLPECPCDSVDSDLSTLSKTSCVSNDEPPLSAPMFEQPQLSSDVQGQHQSTCTEPPAPLSSPIQSLPECPRDPTNSDLSTLSETSTVSFDELRRHTSDDEGQYESEPDSPQSTPIRSLPECANNTVGADRSTLSQTSSVGGDVAPPMVQPRRSVTHSNSHPMLRSLKQPPRPSDPEDHRQSTCRKPAAPPSSPIQSLPKCPSPNKPSAVGHHAPKVNPVRVRSASCPESSRTKKTWPPFVPKCKAHDYQNQASYQRRRTYSLERRAALAHPKKKNAFV